MRGSAAFRTSVTPGGALAGPWVRNPLWNAARSVPSLDLRFADNKSLVDATTGQNLVTFTRASSGTYVDSQGVIRTATTNLLLRSEEFDNAYWSKTNSTVTANATTAPNGTLTAEKLITNSGASGGRVNVSITATAGTPVTLSCYAKQGETNIFSLFISDGITGRAAEFNLTTGTVSGTPTAGMTASIQPVGDGWYRCVATVAGASLSGTTRSLRIVQNVVANDGTSGLFIWGAQLEESSTVGEYIPTTSTINSAPRFDHNPTTGESLGLLVEESRTNLLVQSEDFLTTWTIHDGLTRTANQIVSPNGSTTADLLAGNGISVGYLEQPTASSNQFVSGTTYTYSVYLKKANTSTCLTLLIGNTFNSGGGNPIATWNLDTGVPSFSNGAAGSMTPVGNGWYRCVVTDTATQTHTQNQQWLRMASASGDVYAWGAQLEAGAFPTSYIPTTTAAVTRSADVASISGSNFSSWYRQDEGTVFGDYLERAFSQTHQVVSVSNGTASERISMAINSSNVLDVGVISGGVDTFAGNTPTLTAQAYRIGFAYKSDSSGVSANGSAVTDDSAVTLPTVSQLDIGARAGTNQVLNSTIRRLTYWPQRLPNSTLQQITQ